MTLSDGQTLQVERPDTDQAWEQMMHDLQQATRATNNPGGMTPCTLVFLRPDGSRQCAVDANSAKGLPDGAFVTLHVGSMDTAPVETSEWQIELPKSSPQQPQRAQPPPVRTAALELAQADPRGRRHRWRLEHRSYRLLLRLHA